MKMDRRVFLKSAGVAAALNMISPGVVPWSGVADALSATAGALNRIPDQAIKDRLIKTRFFDTHFRDDTMLPESDRPLLESSLNRMKRTQRLIGYANFCLAGLDEAVTYGRSYARVGRFTAAELEFLEKIFYSPAAAYGFMGEKPITEMTATITRKKTRKMPGTGNYLYRGKPIQIYRDIQKQIGRDVVLTSGIRGVMKQFLLFLNKVQASEGNLSMASRSLAPPGYSYHGIGDFDVGKKGFGIDNFTEKFTQTRIYNQLSDLGYIKFRYDRKNDLGVRFEPWHVEVG